MTVRSRARIGQPRSHAIAYLARAKACVSLSRASASGPFGRGGGPFNKLSAFTGKSP